MQIPARRADAQMHRTLLLDAADQVFAEHGVHAALELVTAQAGVSRATLYRNFPDRDALMAALLQRSFETLEARALQLSGTADGLFKLLEHMAVLAAESAPVADHWRATGRGSPVLAQAQRRLSGLVKPLLAQAVAAGACRADLTVGDVLLVTTMLGSGLRGRSRTQRRSLSRRALALLLDGLRTHPEGDLSQETTR
ncbi:transcriptional regulator, TetR family [Oryzisolibacter propanilivorax]|uniref:Transcriptional regulator, TetR family n=1 Tax=Oryzisolibacter propanilivorax TaxID=1527607 RepID=A0A1G9PFD7_9BURK|nr:TetR/AcrR family transcriptional regulator [Oryzisolibacter propanilivorax]SDL97201.1 transcriptional regulator, TetR family [Oryzisolibacter propanilivorax]